MLIRGGPDLNRSQTENSVNGFDAGPFLATLTARPGAYRMLDEAGATLYVGKAKNLKARVSSYFRSSALNTKTRALVQKIRDVKVTVTGSETEALLLEQSLIKEQRPPYNIVFRDDKSYPYIYLTSEDEYPRLAFHRGARRKSGRYFGPFPSANAVRSTLVTLQKVMRVRQCEDSFFRNRSRPCLQYQMRRCSGPCCGLVSKENYARDLTDAVLFLEGKSDDLINTYANRMETASGQLDFEEAAKYRDQITRLRRIQEQQYVVGSKGNIDVMAAVVAPGGAAVQMLFIRDGRLLDNKTFFPNTRLQIEPVEVLEAFVGQYYLNRGMQDIPGEVVVSERLENRSILERGLGEVLGRKVQISDRVRSHRAQWLNLARTNAEQALHSHLASQHNMQQRFEALQDSLGMDQLPERLECFDISHSSGEATVASCVVFDTRGPVKSDYRRFNIENITPGDDYAAMHQALTRRYTRLQAGEGVLPDLLLVDGGKGQLNQATQALEELQVTGVQLLGVAKGPERKAGLETLLLQGRDEPLVMAPDSSALHLIQHIRDEAHRFAITGHRQRRDRKRRESELDGIEGVGAKRRQALLRRFGGIRQIRAASEEELARVNGISENLAKTIYAVLHH